MIITIIGSVTVNRDEMRKCKKFFEKLGYQVYIPIDDPEHEKLPLLEKQRRWINHIEESDLIVAVSKIRILDNCENVQLGIMFGESTSYEIAIAEKFQKPIIFW